MFLRELFCLFLYLQFLIFKLKAQKFRKINVLLLNELEEFWRLFYFVIFDFLIFCCFLLIEKGAQKIEKSSCQIRGRDARILQFWFVIFEFWHFFVEKTEDETIKKK